MSNTNQIVYMDSRAFYASLANPSVDVLKTIYLNTPSSHMIKITVKTFEIEYVNVLLGVIEPCFHTCSFKRSDIITFEDPMYHTPNPPEKKRGFWIPEEYFHFNYEYGNDFYEGRVFDECTDARYSFYFELNDYHAATHENPMIIKFKFTDIISVKFRNNETGSEINVKEFEQLFKNMIITLNDLTK